MDERELIDIVTNDIANRAYSQASQYKQAAEKVPFELDVRSVVQPLEALAEAPLEAEINVDELEEAVEAIDERVESEFEAMAAQPERGLLPRTHMPVRPAKNAVTARAALSNGGLATREGLEERAEQAIKQAGVGPKKYSYACAETVYQGDYDEPTIVVDNFEQAPIEDTYRIENETHYEDGEDFESDVLEAPTWCELAPVANRMVKTTASGVDCFLEGIALVDEQKDPSIARLFCGYSRLANPDLTPGQMRNLLYLEALLWQNADHKGPAFDGRKARALAHRGLAERFQRSRRCSNVTWTEFQITDEGRKYIAEHTPDDVLDTLYDQIQSDFISPLDPREQPEYTREDLPG